jgi:RHS repeat-associated protein
MGFPLRSIGGTGSVTSGGGRRGRFGRSSAVGSQDNFYRTYDPTTGRYLQPEPALQRSELVVASAHQRFPLVAYGYAFSNPVHFVDPDGYGPRTAYHFFKNLFELSACSLASARDRGCHSRG